MTASTGTPGPRISLVHPGSVLVAALAAMTGCTEGAFAPQSSAIEIMVEGAPTDGIASVLAYVQDRRPPYNRQEHQLTVGKSVRFGDLGAGFRIEYGITNLNRYNCFVRDGKVSSGLHAAAIDSLDTENEVTHVVTYDVRCRSGVVELTVSGLPAADSARILFANADDTVRVWRRNGTWLVGVVPGTVRVLPAAVAASDGFLYDAPAVTTTPATDQRSPVALQYGVSAQNQAVLEVRVQGAPDDPGVTFQAHVRSLSGPAYVDSATIPLDGAHAFPNLPHESMYEVRLSGLAAHRCRTRKSGGYLDVGDTAFDTATVYRAAFPSSATFEVLCHTAALDVVVSGLPPADSADIDVDAVFSDAQLRMPNETRRVYLVPYRTIVTPHAVAGSDGRIYTAATDTVFPASRQTHTVTVQYAAQLPASITGTVTANGFGIGGATVTLSGAASMVAMTGNAGDYGFVGLAPGTYTLTVSTPFPNVTFPSPTQTVTLAAGQQLVVNFAGSYSAGAGRQAGPASATRATGRRR